MAMGKKQCKKKNGGRDIDILHNEINKFDRSRKTCTRTTLNPNLILLLLGTLKLELFEIEIIRYLSMFKSHIKY